MKTLKWLWFIVMLTIVFKLYNLLSAGPDGSSNSDMESFVGMIFLFALISFALIVFWIIGRAKEKFSNQRSSEEL